MFACSLAQSVGIWSLVWPVGGCFRGIGLCCRLKAQLLLQDVERHVSVNSVVVEAAVSGRKSCRMKSYFLSIRP